ncbi:MAG: hypothetical protein ACREER_03040 [Alphaproteobacteria bacterium]
MMRSTVILATIPMLLALPAAADGLIVVMPDRCAPLAAYEPADDVAFQPGVDAYGRAVVPADLDQGEPPLVDPEDLAIVIEVPVIQADPARPSVRDFDATIEVGTITLDRNGAVRFDDVELKPQAVVPADCE